ncbi:MAG: hypothetical protein Q7S74_05110 [Nanoarchaeota archaeon]|nr:hypothetical protein [Nanoarchaeota archaeon]
MTEERQDYNTEVKREYTPKQVKRDIDEVKTLLREHSGRFLVASAKYIQSERGHNEPPDRTFPTYQGTFLI